MARDVMPRVGKSGQPALVQDVTDERRRKGGRVGLVEQLAVQPDHGLHGLTCGQDELDHVDDLCRTVVERPDGASARPFLHTRRALG